jgi:hypothetical protein
MKSRHSQSSNRKWLENKYNSITTVQAIEMKAWDLSKLTIRIKDDQPITIKKVANWELYKSNSQQQWERSKISKSKLEVKQLRETHTHTHSPVITHCKERERDYEIKQESQSIWITVQTEGNG